MADADDVFVDQVAVTYKGSETETRRQSGSDCCLDRKPVRLLIALCITLTTLTVLVFIGVLIWYILCPILDVGCSGPINSTDFIDNQPWKNATSVHDFKALDIDGKVVDLGGERYRGNVLVIFNVASE